MRHESRLIWVLIDDIPKLLDAKITFSCGPRAHDHCFAVMQLYDNEKIKELDGLGIDWMYPISRNTGRKF